MTIAVSGFNSGEVWLKSNRLIGKKVLTLEKLMRLVTLNWRRISYLNMAGNNESKVSKMKRSFFLSNSIYVRGRNFKQSLEVYLRDPGFDWNTVRAGKRKIFWRETGFCCSPGSAIYQHLRTGGGIFCLYAESSGKYKFYSCKCEVKQASVQ